MIIAVDGPAASGKGTIARRLAATFGLPYLDTGLIYRAAARAVLDAGAPIDDDEAAVAAARGLSLADLDDTHLRGKDMGEAASIVAAKPAVRAALVAAQRAFADRPSGAVLDGRDIGTVICPHAEAKIFVTASADVRARRRTLELHERGERIDYETVLADIRRRDERDYHRSVAPLLQASDAIELETSGLGVEDAVAAAIAIVIGRIPAASARQAGRR